MSGKMGNVKKKLKLFARKSKLFDGFVAFGSTFFILFYESQNIKHYNAKIQLTLKVEIHF